MIQAINEKLNLPGIKARGPLVQTKPNFYVDFPGVLDRTDPVIVIKEAILLHTNLQCTPAIRSVKPKERVGGRRIAFQLPNDVLEKVQNWAFDKKATHLCLFTERLRFWTTAPKSTKPNKLTAPLTLAAPLSQ